jgi:uncharacterized protein
MNKDQQNVVWFKEAYVWLLISFPLAAVIAGVITITLAIQSDDGLVVDDYYKQGLAINRKLERDRKASDYQLSANLQYARDNEKVRLILNGNSAFTYPDELRLSFLNASRAGEDKEIVLMRNNDNTFTASNPELNRGNWHVLIEDDEWRLLIVLNIP